VQGTINNCKGKSEMSGELIKSFIRQILTLLGAWLVSKGIATEADWSQFSDALTTLLGSVMVVWSIGWSYLRHKNEEVKK
jgi:hypothetical protein